MASDNFTLILNQITGTRRVVDKAPEGFRGIDLQRLKAKYPAIAANIRRTGVKVTLTAAVDEDTHLPFVRQTPNEAVEYQCLGGAGPIEHTMKDRAQMSKKGPATLRKLDLKRVAGRCTNLVIVAKGDEHLRAPTCDECRGAGTSSKGANLPPDILGALGLDSDEV